MSEKNIHFMRPFEPYFNVGLGVWIRSRKHYKDELRARGMEEIGNEYVKPKSHEEIANEHYKDLEQRKIWEKGFDNGRN